MSNEDEVSSSPTLLDSLPADFPPTDAELAEIKEKKFPAAVATSSSPVLLSSIENLDKEIEGAAKRYCTKYCKGEDNFITQVFHFLRKDRAWEELSTSDFSTVLEERDQNSDFYKIIFQARFKYESREAQSYATKVLIPVCVQKSKLSPEWTEFDWEFLKNVLNTDTADVWEMPTSAFVECFFPHIPLAWITRNQKGLLPSETVTFTYANMGELGKDFLCGFFFTIMVPVVGALMCTFYEQCPSLLNRTKLEREPKPNLDAKRNSKANTLFENCAIAVKDDQLARTMTDVLKKKVFSALGFHSFEVDDSEFELGHALFERQNVKLLPLQFALVYNQDQKGLFESAISFCNEELKNKKTFPILLISNDLEFHKQLKAEIHTTQGEASLSDVSFQISWEVCKADKSLIVCTSKQFLAFVQNDFNRKAIFRTVIIVDAATIGGDMFLAYLYGSHDNARPHVEYLTSVVFTSANSLAKGSRAKLPLNFVASHVKWGEDKSQVEAKMNLMDMMESRMPLFFAEHVIYVNKPEQKEPPPSARSKTARTQTAGNKRVRTSVSNNAAENEEYILSATKVGRSKWQGGSIMRQHPRSVSWHDSVIKDSTDGVPETPFFANATPPQTSSSARSSTSSATATSHDPYLLALLTENDVEKDTAQVHIVPTPQVIQEANRLYQASSFQKKEHFSKLFSSLHAGGFVPASSALFSVLLSSSIVPCETFLESSDKCSKAVDYTHECCVCQGKEFVNPVVSLFCGHVFCEICLYIWWVFCGKSCPRCKEEMPKMKYQKLIAKPTKPVAYSVLVSSKTQGMFFVEVSTKINYIREIVTKKSSAQDTTYLITQYTAVLHSWRHMLDSMQDVDYEEFNEKSCLDALSAKFVIITWKYLTPELLKELEGKEVVVNDFPLFDEPSTLKLLYQMKTAHFLVFSNGLDRMALCGLSHPLKDYEKRIICPSEDDAEVVDILKRILSAAHRETAIQCAFSDKDSPRWQGEPKSEMLGIRGERGDVATFTIGFGKHMWTVNGNDKTVTYDGKKQAFSSIREDANAVAG